MDKGCAVEHFVVEFVTWVSASGWGGSCSMRISMFRASAICCRPVGFVCLAMFSEASLTERGAGCDLGWQFFVDILEGV